MKNRVADAAETITASAEQSAQQQAETPTPRMPLLLRLEPSIRFQDADAVAPQPVLGASTVLVDPMWPQGGSSSVWFPARVWDGIATIIRQTPDHLRPSVVEFL